MSKDGIWLSDERLDVLVGLMLMENEMEIWRGLRELKMIREAASGEDRRLKPRLADNGLTAAHVEDMRGQWRNNPAMPFAQRVAFCNICDAALVALRPSPPVVEGERADRDPILPCDVTLPPSTTFKAGVPLSALLLGLTVRGMSEGDK